MGVDMAHGLMHMCAAVCVACIDHVFLSCLDCFAPLPYRVCDATGLA